MTTAEFLKARYGQEEKPRNPYSIALLIDKKKNIVINIYHRTTGKYGYGVDIGDYIELPYPYTLEEIGSRVIECFQTRADMPLVTDARRDSAEPTYKILTNGKGFLYWLRRHECIGVRMLEERMSVEYEHRADSGDNRGYSAHREDYGETEILLAQDASAKEIGEAVNQVYLTRNGYGLVS